MTDEIEIPRRTLLGALGAVGVGSAAGGLGTSAFFSDTETFEGNSLVAGELDLKVDWTEHYSDWSPDEGTGIQYSMTDESVGPGFPSAAADKLLYVDDYLQFLDNTAVESYPDTDDDAIQDPFAATPGGTTAAGVGYVCEDGADTPEDLDPTVSLRTLNEDTYDTTLGVVKPLVSLDDVKPGDFGEITFSIHLCGNPGYVWLTGGLADADENGTNEPEAADTDEIGPGEPDPLGRDLFANEGDESSEENADPANTTQEPVELLDAIHAALWYDTGTDGVYGTGDTGEGDNYHQAGEAFIPLVGSLRNVLKLLGDGMVPLDYSPVAGAGTIGTGGGNFEVCTDASDALAVYTNSDLGFKAARNVGCETLAATLVLFGYVEDGTEYVGTKVEAGSLQVGTYTAGNGGIIRVDSVDIQGGTVELSTNFPVEAVKVKGGNEGANYYVFEDKGGTDPTEPEEFGCVLETVTMSTPTGQAISNIEICYDPDTPTDGEVPGQEVGRECFPNSTTAYVGFEWWLPVDHANEIQTDSVSFDLGFYTEQCRHNDGSGQAPETGA